MKQVIIEESRKQIVAGSYRMGISRQMKVDILHRHHLCVPPTGAATFHSKHRTERWLPEGKRGPTPEPSEPHG
jgi:hypothetical protein